MRLLYKENGTDAMFYSNKIEINFDCIKLKKGKKKELKMRRIVVLLLCVGLSSPTFASGFDKNFCLKVAELSKLIMKKRQEQYPEQLMREKVLSNKPTTTTKAREYKVIKFVFEEAYKTPIFKTIEKQEHATRVFTNRMNSSCYDSIKKPH